VKRLLSEGEVPVVDGGGGESGGDAKRIRD
jgi:hypothetical protein